ncbi:H-NS histone family protein [Aquabacterium sp.]|uniref:H-NS histone family protein n=1 Tax=Aquabacterium sp. TaxID=1872578 RepID=UPI002487B8B4|nr:H-NS histone family protein [Aquabacterium sp.]MDI1260897.1 H-NS histone family protein [Aquabacterium sp.]
MLTAEQEAVLRSIRKLLDFWQISPDELGIEELETIVRKVEPPAAPAGPKYQHPRTGDTWNGEGSQPPWIREALTKEGYTVDELRLVTAPTPEQVS